VRWIGRAGSTAFGVLSLESETLVVVGIHSRVLRRKFTGGPDCIGARDGLEIDIHVEATNVSYQSRLQRSICIVRSMR
jgi:hypothetical protein